MSDQPTTGDQGSEPHRERTLEESLRFTVEELRISNEDLASANEELRSLNAALRSSNEELSASKKALQAINEELSTVNVALRREVEELDRAHGDLQNLFTSTQIAALFLNHELRIKRFSPAAKSVFHVIDGDVGRPLTDLTVAFTEPDLVADARRVLRTLEPREEQVHRIEGDVWFIRRARPYRSLEDAVEGVVITYIEITELKRAQARVTHLATLVKSSQESIIGLTLEGTVASWNTGAERLYGYAAAEAVGRPYAMLVPADRAAEMTDAYERMTSGENPEALETTRLRQDGAVVSVHLTLSAVIDAGGAIVGFSAIAHDITARVKAEEALREADRHKNDFLAMLGHELRNPLAPIRNATQILQDLEGGDVAMAHARDTIERQVQHMTRLIDDLLDLSRVSRGKILLRTEPCDLTEVIHAAVGGCRGLAEAGKVAMDMAVPARPLHVLGDPVRLAQMVDNLLHNALKFTDAGGRVAVTVEEDPARGEVVLRVRDTGMGMDARTLSRLFEPFVQADRSLSRSRGGLGLGLALVKTLAELHGGGVTATSEGLGRGAELTLRLPALRAPAAALPDRSAPAGDGPPRRILIVEDNVDAAETLKIVLERRGHEVSLAYTGAEGIEAARGRSPEVVLCDIGLPGEVDGYAVARALRADPTTSGAFLVALTGYGQDEDRRLTAEAGFDEHLVKPAAWTVLRQLLARLG